MLLAHVPHCQLPFGAVGLPAPSKARQLCSARQNSSHVSGVCIAGSAEQFQPISRLQEAQLPRTAIPQQHPRKASVLQAQSELQPHCFAHLCRVTKPDRGYRISILSKNPNAQLKPRKASAHLKRVTAAPRLHFWSKSVAEVLPTHSRQLDTLCARSRSRPLPLRVLTIAHISTPFVSQNLSRAVSHPPDSPADFSAVPPPFPYGPGRCSTPPFCPISEWTEPLPRSPVSGAAPGAGANCEQNASQRHTAAAQRSGIPWRPVF